MRKRIYTKNNTDMEESTQINQVAAFVKGTIIV